MEQLATIDKFYEQRRIFAAWFEKKAKMRMTTPQLEAFDMIMKRYMSTLVVSTFRDKAFLFRLYKLYQKHIEPKTFKIQKEFKFSLSLGETYTLYEFLQGLDFSDYGPYEYSLLNKIYGEIDRQII